jgi:hypothetical protein
MKKYDKMQDNGLVCLADKQFFWVKEGNQFPCNVLEI